MVGVLLQIMHPNLIGRSGDTCGFPEPFPTDLWETTRTIFYWRGHLAGSPEPPPRGVYQTSPWYIYLSGTPCCFRGIVGQRRKPLQNDAN